MRTVIHFTTQNMIALVPPLPIFVHRTEANLPHIKYDIKNAKTSFTHYPQMCINVMQKSTSQIRLQALYYLLVRRGFAERFYQAGMVGQICEIGRPFLFVIIFTWAKTWTHQPSSSRLIWNRRKNIHTSAPKQEKSGGTAPALRGPRREICAFFVYISHVFFN